MSRYVIGAKADKPLYVETPLWGDVEPFRPNLIVDTHSAVDTGLIAPTGEAIMRVPEPMGFHRAGK